MNTLISFYNDYQAEIINTLLWVHCLAGMIWIGFLYYFNFVQEASLPQIGDSAKNLVLGPLAPQSLWWFRWGAMWTFLSGLVLVINDGSWWQDEFFVKINNYHGVFSMIGMVLGTLMFLNVWLVMWPKQKVIMSSALSEIQREQGNPESVKFASSLLLVSRTNVIFSMPMLFFMGARHYDPYPSPTFFIPALGVIFLIILALQYNALKGKLGPLASVKGVIICGLGLMVLFGTLIDVLAS